MLVPYHKQIFIYRSFFYGNTVTEQTHLARLQNWFLPQMNEDSGDFNFQQD
jgi:hypothetical protein